MTTFYLHRYTFIRLAIPWIAGVFCGDYFFDEKSEMLWCILFLSLFVGSSLTFYFLKRYSLRWCFGISITGLCLMGGWTGISWQLKQVVHNFPKEERVYRVLLANKPELKEKSYLCRVILKEVRDSEVTHSSDKRLTPNIKAEASKRIVFDSHVISNKEVILYLAQDSFISRLKGGEELLVSTIISPPKNGGNFEEFDYARYLIRKGISGTGYVSSGKWKKLPVTPSHSFREIASSYREKVLVLYRTLGFENDELAVLSALTIGDKTELSESIQESYSVSGASHVLALSGLHIGLLYALLFFMLKPITERWRMGRYLRSIFLILLLWTFAFFTGLSPSVVRSASMFSILALAALLKRDSFSLNTVLATAFLMLICNPVWLFDVGFQLSFLAVVAILLIQPLLYRLISVRTRLGKYVWGLMSVSIAAQLGTAPFVLFYFSRFSTHFLLTNLVVIPLVTITLYSAVLMLVMVPFPLSGIQTLMASIVRFLLETLNHFIRWIEHLPYASLDGIWIYKPEIIFFYILLSFICYYFISHRIKMLLLSLSCLLLLCTFHIVMGIYDRPQRSVVFYNVRGCPVVHSIESDGHSWLCYGSGKVDKKRLRQVTSNFWRRQKLLEPIELPSDVQKSEISIHQQIIQFHSCRICMITDNRWQNKKVTSPLNIQYLYLCKGYIGHLKELTGLFHPSCVILDSSLSEYRKQYLQAECRRCGIESVSLSRKGSVQFLL